MKIYFARHGQTDWNILGKVQGTTDIPLNENGIAQAQLLCKNLEDRDISFEKNPTEGPWGNQGYPEIEDLTVFFDVHNKGIGNRLLDAVEKEASKVSDKVYLAVGVHSGYGPAQRMYVKRGYNFDGSGVWYKGKQLEQYAPCINDDDLLLYLAKDV